ncbi:MAG: SDR family NAD(P)-dependent oxidoreductase, partial [Gammaproteobacteria bacterium]
MHLLAHRPGKIRKRFGHPSKMMDVQICKTLEKTRENDTMATVMITGANRGIGLELTKRYAAAGNEVIACCREPDKANALHDLDNVQICGVTVADGDSVAALAAEIGDRPIDILINNAGTPGPAPDQQSALQ